MRNLHFFQENPQNMYFAIPGSQQTQTNRSIHVQVGIEFFTGKRPENNTKYIFMYKN